MSAFLVSNNHFNVLASYFASNVMGEGLWCELNDDYNYLTPETAEVAFWVLVNENTRSLQSRYPEYKDMWANAKQYKFKYIPNLKSIYSVGEIAMALDCLEYQSCEGSNYHESDAYKLITSMRKHLLKKIQDRDNADTWGIEEVKSKRMVEV